MKKSIKDKNTWYVFIDESGSLNNSNKGSFLVSLIIINELNYNKVKKISMNAFWKWKQELNFNTKDELKAHHLKLNNKIPELSLFCSHILKFNSSYASFLDNKNIDIKRLDDKNATYNFMVKAALERWIENENILNCDEKQKLIIKADNRNIATKYLLGINFFLNKEFCTNKKIFSNISFEYLDSSISWGIQLADLFSFYNYRIRRRKIKNDFQFKNIRNIY